MCKTRSEIELIISNSTFPNGLLSSDWYTAHHTLARLYFANCKINYIEKGAFNYMKDLKILSFKKTVDYIEIAEDGILEPLRSLENLEIEDSLNSAIVLRNITGNQKVSRNLQIVQLNWNNLGSLDSTMLSGLTNVASLYIQSSNLVSIDVSAFVTFSRSIRNIFLVGNSLQTLSEGIFKNVILDIAVIDLRQNNWYCDCKLKWLQDIINSHHQIHDVSCTSPEQYKDLSIKEVELCSVTTTDTSISSTTTSTTLQSTTETTEVNTIPTQITNSSTVSSTTETNTGTTPTLSTTTTEPTTEPTTTTTTEFTSTESEETTSTAIFTEVTTEPNIEVIYINCTDDRQDNILEESVFTKTEEKLILNDMSISHLYSKHKRNIQIPYPLDFKIKDNDINVQVEVGDCVQCKIVYGIDKINNDSKCIYNINRTSSPITVKEGQSYSFCLMDPNEHKTHLFNCLTHRKSDLSIYEDYAIGIIVTCLVTVIIIIVICKFKRKCDSRLQYFYLQGCSDSTVHDINESAV